MIFVPKVLHVGFQNTDSKLSFVTYEDDKGVMRQAQSFNDWVRGSKVKFDNKPVTGVMLDSGSNSPGWGGWNKRASIARIVDPRGFMFEIRMENLVYLLQMGGYDGKTGFPELIYSWDSGKIVLIPTASQEYKNALVSTEVQSKYLKVADIKVGTTYSRKSGGSYTYLGKFPVMKYNWSSGTNEPDGEQHVFSNGYYMTFMKTLSGKFVQEVKTPDGFSFSEELNKFLNSADYKHIDRSLDQKVYLSSDDILSTSFSRYKYALSDHCYGGTVEFLVRKDEMIQAYTRSLHLNPGGIENMSVENFIHAYEPYKVMVFFSDGSLYRELG